MQEGKRENPNPLRVVDYSDSDEEDTNTTKNDTLETIASTVSTVTKQESVKTSDLQSQSLSNVNGTISTASESISLSNNIVSESVHKGMIDAEKFPLLSNFAPIPTTPASQNVETRFATYLQLSHQGHDFTSTLRRKKDFGNPNLLEKVIERFEIDQYSSAYPTNLFNPKISSTINYRTLATLQQTAEDERIARQKTGTRTNIPFVESSAKSISSTDTINASIAQARARAAAIASAAMKRN